MPARLMPKSALISVSDKSGIDDLAKAFRSAGLQIISTGGTAKYLRDAGLKVTDITEITGFEEMMGGRVKTLHPHVHGAILARRDFEEDQSALSRHNIMPIDLVIVNLYPFQETAQKGEEFDACIEEIDIGGPALIRSAAKNHRYTTVVTNPDHYTDLIDELAAGGTSYEFRKRLAAGAFRHTADYDQYIAGWFANQVNGEQEAMPQTLTVTAHKHANCRYGENPHQQAAFYSFKHDKPTGLVAARQLQGKELSYNNINDTNAALELISDLPIERPSVAIIKHANPCGVAVADTMKDAYLNAFACDSVSAFGGIIAVNQTLGEESAAEIVKIFTEVVIAPKITDAAKAVFRAKKNLRLLEVPLLDPDHQSYEFRTIAGGMLVQTRDNRQINALDLKIVTKREPTPQELSDLIFAFRVSKHVKSNAIVYARNGMTVGIGAGQMNRRDSSRIAAVRAGEAREIFPDIIGKGCVAASDAFFPFADGLLETVKAGATAVIQPGGSIRDDEVIEAANKAGIAMVFTGTRHFRH